MTSGDRGVTAGAGLAPQAPLRMPARPNIPMLECSCCFATRINTPKANPVPSIFRPHGKPQDDFPISLLTDAVPAAVTPLCPWRCFSIMAWSRFWLVREGILTRADWAHIEESPPSNISRRACPRQAPLPLLPETNRRINI